MAAFGPMALTLLFEMLLGSVPASGEVRAVVEPKHAPVPSIALPAVGHLPIPEPAAPVHIEAAADEPAPLPPSRHKKAEKNAAEPRGR